MLLLYHSLTHFEVTIWLETFVSWPELANMRQTGCIIIRESLQPQQVGHSLVFLVVQL